MQPTYDASGRRAGQRSGRSSALYSE